MQVRAGRRKMPTEGGREGERERERRRRRRKTREKRKRRKTIERRRVHRYISTRARVKNEGHILTVTTSHRRCVYDLSAGSFADHRCMHIHVPTTAGSMEKII